MTKDWEREDLMYADRICVVGVRSVNVRKGTGLKAGKYWIDAASQGVDTRENLNVRIGVEMVISSKSPESSLTVHVGSGTEIALLDCSLVNFSV